MYELTYVSFASNTCSTEEEDVMKEVINLAELKLKNKTSKRYETLNKKANYDDWREWFAMSKDDAVIPKTSQEKSDRIASIDNLNINVEQLFIALNERMEEEPSIRTYLNKYKDLADHDFTKRNNLSYEYSDMGSTGLSPEGHSFSKLNQIIKGGIEQLDKLEKVIYLNLLHLSTSP